MYDIAKGQTAAEEGFEHPYGVRVDTHRLVGRRDPGDKLRPAPTSVNRGLEVEG